MASLTELDAFLSSPERFIPPGAPRPLPPPELLPQRRSHANVKAMFPKQFEIQGFCPVSYVDGNKRYRLIFYHTSLYKSPFKIILKPVLVCTPGGNIVNKRRAAIKCRVKLRVWHIPHIDCLLSPPALKERPYCFCYLLAYYWIINCRKVW